MNRILILKTAALGDVLRTTSILPGIAERHGPCAVTWVTASDAAPLIASHRLIERLEVVDVADPGSVQDLIGRLDGEPWDWIISLDDEVPLCRIATVLESRRLSGAYLEADGARAYTQDVEPWFGMGLLARDGKEAADRRKVENERTHPEIFARMLGVPMGQPEFAVSHDALHAGREAVRVDGRRVVGLFTGAAGRWHTKALPSERVVELVGLLQERLAAPVRFALFGGHAERDRNAEIVEGVRRQFPSVDLVDTGPDNNLEQLGALVSACDLMVTSDSLGMHVAIARRVPLVAFFAPTSAAEIELYGLGEKVVSTSPDYCSYRPDADNSTITAERLADAVERVADRAFSDRTSA